MKLTLLLDLDNTLLENDQDVFLPAYLKSLSLKFPQWPPDLFIKKLLNATQGMTQNNSAKYTLEQVFDASFYPALGVEKQDLADRLDQFYQTDFNRLSRLTRMRPAAVQLVENALAAGCDIVVATNPVFPAVAIHNRLRWAGFPSTADFRMVTSFENLHFTKPNPAYFAEILAQLGFPDQPVLMVGDNYSDDIIPATSIGIPSFWVTTKGGNSSSSLVRAGNLDEVWGWVNELADHTAPFSGNGSIPAVLATLKSSPAAAKILCKDLPAEAWHTNPDSKEWAINEILCHLRDVDREVNLPRIIQVSQGLTPFLPGAITDVWADERMYIDQSGPEALSAFIDVRAEITQLLDQLAPDSWNQTARHAIFGPTTLIELIGFIATHDIVHIRQLQQTKRSLAI
jgi:FMN phosphatase YigB (HAD superfamily)